MAGRRARGRQVRVLACSANHRVDSSNHPMFRANNPLFIEWRTQRAERYDGDLRRTKGLLWLVWLLGMIVDRSVSRIGLNSGPYSEEFATAA